LQTVYSIVIWKSFIAMACFGNVIDHTFYWN